MEIKALPGDKILIKPAERPQTTAAGIILTAQKQQYEGEVLLTGPHVKHIKVGDKVRLYEHCGVDIGEGIIAKEATEVESVL